MKKHQLVLLRHGESTWNQENRFTGWVDVDLSAKGLAEARAAGELLRDEKFLFDRAFTSVLKRAIRTLWHVLEQTDQMWLPVTGDWRLNERHYGALQGLNKAETAAKYGDEQVHVWRRSYATPPPALELTDPNHPRFDRRYDKIDPKLLPSHEDLKTTLERVLPYWENEIAPVIKNEERVLIVAHGNSLRALIKHLDGISDEEITELNIPTGIPLLYVLDENLKPLEKRYLGNAKAAAEAAEKVKNQSRAH